MRDSPLAGWGGSWQPQTGERGRRHPPRRSRCTETMYSFLTYIRHNIWDIEIIFKCIWLEKIYTLQLYVKCKIQMCAKVLKWNWHCTQILSWSPWTAIQVWWEHVLKMWHDSALRHSWQNLLSLRSSWIVHSFGPQRHHIWSYQLWPTKTLYQASDACIKNYVLMKLNHSRSCKFVFLQLLATVMHNIDGGILQNAV